MLRLMFMAGAVMIFGACQDDEFENFGPKDYPEGVTEVRMGLDFEPVSGSGERSRSLPGKSMDRLDDLCLVAYDADGNLMAGFPLQVTLSPSQIKDVPRDPEDASNGHLAESATKHADFTLRLPYGKYYLYGVANLGARNEDGTVATSTYAALTTGEFKDAVNNREDLLNYATEWDESNPLNNFEMLGFFSNGKAETAPVTGDLTNNVMVDVDGPSVSLHCWLRRSCAKVTVDFDAGDMRENIYVYIRRATIHNLPKRCRLGMPNAARDEKDVFSYKDSDYRPEQPGHSIEYGTGDDHAAWPRVSKGSPTLRLNGEEYDWHGENAPSLFVYENMKGDDNVDKSNKEQLPGPDGLVIGSTDVEDNMKGATYIEVEGYYEQTSGDDVSHGKIIYRFMLGEDALRNFDVERNRHIKVTMRLRGNANDVDWHIEYERNDEFEYKDPYYVSYLYNHESTIHFRYTPPENLEVEKLTAEIVANNWWPDDPSAGYSESTMREQSPIEPELWNGDVLELAYKQRNIYDNTAEAGLRGKVKYLGNGWLSLRETDDMVITYEETSAHGSYNSGTWQSFPDNAWMNDRYFYGVTGGVDRSFREYKFKEYDPDNNGRESYSVEDYPDGSKRFNLPVFTRAKNLVKQTGYSGNNMFEGSTRTAIVRVTVYLSDGTTRSRNLRVVQVPRLVNPKGIYRRSGNNENFHVVLTERTSPVASTFTAVKSDGPWLAEVIGDDNFISLNGRRLIKGSTGSEIDFNVVFNKLNRDNKVRNAVIRIRYHNYTCVHLIFVRQGYSSQQIGPGGAEWYATNVITENVDALDPRDEGSMFKFGNISYPIDVFSNQGYGMNLPPANMTPSSFSPAGDLYKARDDRGLPGASQIMKWSDFNGSISTGFSSASIPSMAQIAKMYDTAGLQHGFGVLYADGATEVQYTTEGAYGYFRHDSSPARDKHGMRGVFMYYWDGNDDISGSEFNCRNVFFPIGMAGYGHRRSYDFEKGSTSSYNSLAGTQRYACGRSGEMAPSSIPFCPLLYDLYRRNGAIYWAASVTGANDVTGMHYNDAMAMDLNYYTFDVNLISKTNVQKHSQWSGCDHDEHIDACYLRRVGHHVVP